LLLFSKRSAFYLHPGAPGCAPHPPAVPVAFIFWPGGSLCTTVPSCVVPCAAHSQKPPTGICVTQASFGVWQMFAAMAALLPSSAATRDAAPKNREQNIPEHLLSWTQNSSVRLPDASGAIKFQGCGMISRPAGAMIGMAGGDSLRAIDLLSQHDPHQHVRPRHGAK